MRAGYNTASWYNLANFEIMTLFFASSLRVEKGLDKVQDGKVIRY